MTEQERLDYLADRQKNAPTLSTWAPKLTPEQKAAQEEYIRDNNLPF